MLRKKTDNRFFVNGQIVYSNNERQKTHPHTETIAFYSIVNLVLNVMHCICIQMIRAKSDQKKRELVPQTRMKRIEEALALHRNRKKPKKTSYKVKP